jgi:hypothetical protein
MIAGLALSGFVGFVAVAGIAVGIAAGYYAAPSDVQRAEWDAAEKGMDH